MKPFPFELTQLSLLFRSLFSKIVWPSVQVLVTGAILAVGTRTVTAVLRVMGHSEEQQFQKFHRVLNRFKWSPLAASRRLLMALMETFVPQGPFVMALDDKIERRQGARIAAKGIYRDPVHSSHSHFVKASGLRWLCLMLIAPIPWARRDWALPFCTALTPSERYYRDRGRRAGKLTDRARQMLLMVKRWLPQRDIVIVADSSVAAIELLAAVSPPVCVITRLLLDAALYEAAARRRSDKIGRPRREGVRLPPLQTVLANARTSWQTVTVARWYSQGERNVDVASGTAVWYHAGKPVVPLRWVLTRPTASIQTPGVSLYRSDDITRPSSELVRQALAGRGDL
jgi:hypothetical protein